MENKSKKPDEVYLFGVDHRVQWDRNFEETSEFTALLIEKVEEYGIQIIIEEFSKEALFPNNVETTTTQDVAKDLEKLHMFCDQETNERKKIGCSHKQLRERFGTKSAYEGTIEYKKRKEFEKRHCWPSRERYWFKGIRECAGLKILFICGCSHLESFNKLLVGKGYKTIIVYPTN